MSLTITIYLHCSSGELDLVLDKLGEDQDYQEEEDISVSQKSGNGKIFNGFYSRVRGFNFRGIFTVSFRIQDSKFLGKSFLIFESYFTIF